MMRRATKLSWGGLAGFCGLIALPLLNGTANAALVTMSLGADTAHYYSDGNLLHGSNPNGSGTTGPVQMSVVYDTTQFSGCVNSSDSSWCTANAVAGAMTATFTTSTTSGTQTFTVTGGGAAFSPVQYPEGFPSNTGGGVHIYKDINTGNVDIQFYTFGTNGHYMANLLHSSSAWVSGSVATDAAFVQNAINNFNSSNWFYSGPFTDVAGQGCGVGQTGPYCNGGNFAPGNYYEQFGNLSAVALADTTVSVPEPGTLALLSAGLIGVVARRRKKS